ncbi:hypothetical protein Tco_1533867 [Tanacetum coccineum]
MRALMVHHGCDAALETLPVNMEAGEKAALMKKAYSTLIICLGDRVLQKVAKETTAWILDLANIDIENEDEDQALMLLILLSSSYENFVETLLYGRESLTMENALATLNSRELKKRTECTNEKTSDGLYARGGQIIKGHLKRDCPLKKSSEFVRKGKYDQDSDFSDEEGNTYFGEALVVVENDEMYESDMRYQKDREREDTDYNVKMQMGKIKVIKGCQVMMIEIKKKNYLHTLEAKVMPFSVQKHRDSKQVRFNQLGSKQVGFKQLGVIQVGFKQLVPSVETGVHEVQVDDQVWLEAELQGAQGNREAEVFQVSNDDAGVAQSRLEDKQLEKKTNTNCLVKEQENAHLEDNVAEKKKVKECVKTNLGKLLKYNA